MTRCWTFEAARELLPDVRRRTQRAVEAVARLHEQREALAEDDEDRARLESLLRREVSRWIREMEALGLSVKGAWRVDFEAEHGCYCWRWPETGLAFFHGPDEGFDERTPIH